MQDAATGLTYMQQRYYDPQCGCFLSVDPVTADPNTGAHFNRYNYANNNPYRFTDPDGRTPREDVKDRKDWRSITAKSPGAAAQMATSARPTGTTSSSRPQTSATKPASNESNRGGYMNFAKPNYETEAVAAYGAGVRYTRDWETKKDALGVVLIGAGAHGGPGKGITGLPGLDVVKAGYNWGGTDSPVDIVANFEVGFMGVSFTFDPGTGFDAAATVSPSIGGYSGVSVMFDDTLVPDK